jgi:hypothetical protein
MVEMVLLIIQIRRMIKRTIKLRKMAKERMILGRRLEKTK